MYIIKVKTDASEWYYGPFNSWMAAANWAAKMSMSHVTIIQLVPVKE